MDIPQPDEPTTTVQYEWQSVTQVTCSFDSFEDAKQDGWLFVEGAFRREISQENEKIKD